VLGNAQTNLLYSSAAVTKPDYFTDSMFADAQAYDSFMGR
jgi:hypothetical protein